MGKGYNNYMCKKPFHPGSKANIKRAWMAEQKTENEKKKQEELKVQYEKEQDLYKNRALISSESKDKLELNFMYEAPPGAKRERQKEDDEPEYKFEWQRKYNAPREDYAKGNAEIKDQPFGIPVRNVKCIKCHKWGHINTDKECPLYSQASTSSMPTTSMDPMELMKQMREDGFGLKENVLGHRLNPKAANQQLIPSEEESDPEAEFLKSLSTADKKKLLRKLKKLSKKQEKKAKSKKKKSKKSKKKSKKYTSDSDSDNKLKHKKRRKESSSSSSNSSSSESESENEAVKQIPDKTKVSGEKNSKSAAYKSDVNRNLHTNEVKMHKRGESDVPKDQNKFHKHTKDSRDKEDYHNLKPDSKRDGTKSSHPGKEVIEPKRKSKKHKTTYSSTEETFKKIKTEKIDPDEVSAMDSEKPLHPDGFSHACPQAVVPANYEQVTMEYAGGQHDRFRDVHRDDRSPSVKQKYNK